MKSQMRKANKSQSRFTLILGENEIRSGNLKLKNMDTGEQKECLVQNLATEIT